MQKKLIALAVAAMASGAAFAQSNVQIYGAVDMGYSFRSDNFNNKVGNQGAIDSGLSDGNRLGFKGTEDLGNGLKALFTLEMGFLADTGRYDPFVGDANGSSIFSRQAMVGLSGKFGTAVAGRLNNPQYALLTAIDPFGEGTVGTYGNIAGNDVMSGLALIPRLDNAAAYVSPDFSGFNVTVAYSSNGVTQDRTGWSGNNNRVYGVLPRYTNGPIDIGVSYHRINFDHALGLDDLRNWSLGGTYDFGMVKLAAFYADTNLDISGNVADLKVKNWMLGATVPFGKHAVMASYNTSKAEQGSLSSADSDQWAIGYTYALSKRTNVYAAYADISNDNPNGNNVNQISRTSAVNDASNAGGDYATQGYQSGFQFGVKHLF